MLIQLLISLDFLHSRIEVCSVVSKQDRRLIVGPDGICSSLLKCGFGYGCEDQRFPINLWGAIDHPVLLLKLITQIACL
jgi:hypothetical protein